MNPSLLALVGSLTILMLGIFMGTGQPLHLTVTAVLITGGLGVGAVFFYARDEAAEPEPDEDTEEDAPKTETEEPQTG